MCVLCNNTVYTVYWCVSVYSSFCAYPVCIYVAKWENQRDFPSYHHLISLFIAGTILFKLCMFYCVCLRNECVEWCQVLVFAVVDLWLQWYLLSQWIHQVLYLYQISVIWKLMRNLRRLNIVIQTICVCLAVVHVMTGSAKTRHNQASLNFQHTELNSMG